MTASFLLEFLMQIYMCKMMSGLHTGRAVLHSLFSNCLGNVTAETSNNDAPTTELIRRDQRYTISSSLVSSSSTKAVTAQERLGEP